MSLLSTLLFTVSAKATFIIAVKATKITTDASLTRKKKWWITQQYDQKLTVLSVLSKFQNVFIFYFWALLEPWLSFVFVFFNVRALA